MPSPQSIQMLYERAIRNLTIALKREPARLGKCDMDDKCENDFQLIPFLDRLNSLLIGSAHFERCYQAALIKYARTGNLRNLSLDFSITNGAFLADPYADAELDNSGQLKLYWRYRRQTTRPGLTVRWIFGGEENRNIGYASSTKF